MLVQVSMLNQIVNVHLEQMKGNLLSKLGRADKEYVRIQVQDCVSKLLGKYQIMYTERK